MKYQSLLLIGCLTLTGCLEATFQLAPSSRVPKWFPAAENLLRDDVTVTLSYYTGGTAKASLARRSGRTLSIAKGTCNWHPAMMKKTNSHGGFDPDAYPTYEVVTMNGITEVIEHRAMEPVFYVTDDPSLTTTVNE
jgi:hypothetical protein